MASSASAAERHRRRRLNACDSDPSPVCESGPSSCAEYINAPVMASPDEFPVQDSPKVSSTPTPTISPWQTPVLDGGAIASQDLQSASSASTRPTTLPLQDLPTYSTSRVRDSDNPLHHLSWHPNASSSDHLILQPFPSTVSSSVASTLCILVNGSRLDASRRYRVSVMRAGPSLKDEKEDLSVADCFYQNLHSVTCDLPAMSPGPRLIVLTESDAEGSNVSTRCVAEGPLFVESSSERLSFFLESVANPLSALADALGLDIADNAALDRRLVKIFQHNAPYEPIDRALRLPSAAASATEHRSTLRKYPTLLHLAASFGLKDLCANLLDCPGIEVLQTVCNIDEQTPQQLAAASGFHELASFLSDYQRKKSVVDEARVRLYETIARSANLYGFGEPSSHGYTPASTVGDDNDLRDPSSLDSETSSIKSATTEMTSLSSIASLTTALPEPLDPISAVGSSSTLVSSASSASCVSRSSTPKPLVAGPTGGEDLGYETMIAPRPTPDSNPTSESKTNFVIAGDLGDVGGHYVNGVVESVYGTRGVNGGNYMMMMLSNAPSQPCLVSAETIRNEAGGNLFGMMPPKPHLLLQDPLDPVVWGLERDTLDGGDGKPATLPRSPSMASTHSSLPDPFPNMAPFHFKFGKGAFRNQDANLVHSWNDATESTSNGSSRGTTYSEKRKKLADFDRLALSEAEGKPRTKVGLINRILGKKSVKSPVKDGAVDSGASSPSPSLLSPGSSRGKYKHSESSESSSTSPQFVDRGSSPFQSPLAMSTPNSTLDGRRASKKSEKKRNTLSSCSNPRTESLTSDASEEQSPREAERPRKDSIKGGRPRRTSEGSRSKDYVTERPDRNSQQRHHHHHHHNHHHQQQQQSHCHRYSTSRSSHKAATKDVSFVTSEYYNGKDPSSSTSTQLKDFDSHKSSSSSKSHSKNHHHHHHPPTHRDSCSGGCNSAAKSRTRQFSCNKPREALPVLSPPLPQRPPVSSPQTLPLRPSSQRPVPVKPTSMTAPRPSSISAPAQPVCTLPASFRQDTRLCKSSPERDYCPSAREERRQRVRSLNLTMEPDTVRADLEAPPPIPPRARPLSSTPTAKPATHRPPPPPPSDHFDDAFFPCDAGSRSAIALLGRPGSDSASNSRQRQLQQQYRRARSATADVTSEVTVVRPVSTTPAATVPLNPDLRFLSTGSSGSASPNVSASARYFNATVTRPHPVILARDEFLRSSFSGVGAVPVASDAFLNLAES